MRNAVLTLLALLATAAPTAAGTPARPSTRQLLVRSYDAYGLRPVELEAAQAVVREIFARAGIDLRWLACAARTSDPCDAPPRAHELIVRLLRTSIPVEQQTFTMGNALVGEHASTSGLITIYPSLVSRLADGATADGSLLGRVIAHEIGHLLLGPAHSPYGLMRPVWTGADVVRNTVWDWMFSAGEARRMRERCYFLPVD